MFATPLGRRPASFCGRACPGCQSGRPLWAAQWGRLSFVLRWRARALVSKAAGKVGDAPGCVPLSSCTDAPCRRLRSCSVIYWCRADTRVLWLPELQAMLCGPWGERLSSHADDARVLGPFERQAILVTPLQHALIVSRWRTCGRLLEWLCVSDAPRSVHLRSCVEARVRGRP